MKRRHFVRAIPAVAAIRSVSGQAPFPISCNSYNWHTFYKRVGKVWGQDIDADIRHFAETGIPALEPNIESVAMGRTMLEALTKYKISMPSIYVNSTLHEAKEVKPSIQKILEIADLVRSYGTRIIVTNPSPISWGGETLKTDAQLRVQAQALNELGARLKARDMILAYHTHDMEMKAGAREFHHMMQNTSHQNMRFCLDLHWIYRGSADSALAVYDTIRLYGHRIAELHLRQSIAGVWQESFTADGDIDYQQVVTMLRRLAIRPHLVIEQCLEAKSPQSLDVVEAHRKNLSSVKRLFGV
jgi:inosose dehydratase